MEIINKYYDPDEYNEPEELTPEESKTNLKFWLKFIGEDLNKVFAVSRMKFVEDRILNEEDYKILFNKCEEILNNKKKSVEIIRKNNN